jgi:hypothetical protein
MPNAMLRSACGFYRALLHGYPKEFRARYGAEMVQVLADRWRDTLANEGPMGIVRFCIHAIWDVLSGILKERFTMRGVLGIFCLVAAIGFGLYAGYVDRHNATEVYPTLMVVLVASLVLGLLEPSHAWRWALIVAVCVPFSGPISALPSRIITPGDWGILAVVLVPGFIGAYSGALLRLALGSMQRGV